MNHIEVLEEIGARGLSIAAEGADLKLRGPRERIDAELVGRIRAVKPELLTHLARQAGFALTPLQAGYLAGRDELFELGNVASYVYHEIEGCWDLPRLEAALRAVVRRHGTLRTRFTEQGTQVQESDVDIRIETLDLRGLPAAARAERLARERELWSHRMLPAGTAPLLAAQVTLLAEHEMVLRVGHDGLVMDGISMFLFFRAWFAHYAGDPEPAEEASFAGYVAELEQARARKPYQRSRRFWLDRIDELAGHPDLPLATNPSAISRPRFTQRRVRVPAPHWAALKERAAAEGITPSGLLLAAYAETLACWGAGTRFTLNTTVANRPPVHPRILEAIGPFSDPMLVEVDLDRSCPFVQRARSLQERLRTAVDHRHFSGVEVLRALAARDGVPVARMPFTFNSAIGYPLSDVDGSTLELFGREVFTVSQTPQIWLNAFAMEQHGAAVVQLDGVDELFPPGLLDDLAEGYQRLLDTLADPAAWHHTLFDLLPAAQRERRTAANDTAVPLPDTLLQQPFLAHARRAPDAPAVITSAGCMSYGELHRRAAVVAGWLRAGAVGRDELVGLVMRRGPEQIIGIMATVMAGAAYLPVDATLPAQRQEVLLEDGQVRCVLTNAGWSDPTHLRAVLTLDAAAPEPAAVPPIAPVAGAHPDDLAYVLYTSGTTGRPKGVMVSHRNVANVVADCAERFGVGPADRLFAISAFNFDLSVYDVFGALSAGAAIVMPDHDRAADPAHWLDMCERGGVTIWNSVPQLVALLHEQAVADGPSALSALRLVMMSGDRVPPELPATLRHTLPCLEVVSLGGPTETTIWNILHPVGKDEDGSASIPYGRPNANNRAYVLDADGLDAPDWVAGEICASGTGLARGYWGDQERTDERFFLDPMRGERLYRTGDLGRWLPSGEIDILGRADFQIKVNGYRIEAGEVETRLVAVAGVRQAVVARQAGSRGDRLVAHLVAEPGERPAEEAVRAALRAQLPEYMVPSAIVWHEVLPLTRNGKVDRARLSATPAPRVAAGPVAPAPGVERELAELWASVLKVSDVDAVTRLAELGGDSLAAARILAGVRKRYRITIPLHQVSEVDTVRAMAARIGVTLAGAA